MHVRLSEIRQSQKDGCYRKFLESSDSEKLKGEWAGGGGTEELLLNEDRVSVLQGEKVLETDGGDGSVTV